MARPRAAIRAPKRTAPAPRKATTNKVAARNSMTAGPVSHSGTQHHALTRRLGAEHSLGSRHHGGHHNGLSSGGGIKQVQQSFAWTTRLFNFSSLKGVAGALTTPSIRFLCSGGSPFFSHIVNGVVDASTNPDGENEWAEGTWMPEAIASISDSFEEYRLTKFNVRFVPVSKRVDHRGTITGMAQDSIFEQAITEDTRLSLYPGSEERSPMQAFGNHGLQFNCANKFHRSKMQIVKLPRNKSMVASKIDTIIGNIQDTVAGIVDFQMEDVATIPLGTASTPTGDPMEYAVWIDAAVQFFQFTGRKNTNWQEGIAFGPSAPETFVAQTGPSYYTADHLPCCAEFRADKTHASGLAVFQPTLKSQTIENNFAVNDFMFGGDSIKPLTPGYYKLGLQLHLSQIGCTDGFPTFMPVASPTTGATIDVEFEFLQRNFNQNNGRSVANFKSIVGIEGRTAWSATKVYTQGVGSKNTGNKELPNSDTRKAGASDLGLADYHNAGTAFKTYVNVDTTGVLLYVSQADVDNNHFFVPVVKLHHAGKKHDNILDPYMPRTFVGPDVVATSHNSNAHGNYAVVTQCLRVDSFSITLIPVDNIDPLAVADEFVTMDTLKIEDGRTFQRKDTFQAPQLSRFKTYADVITDLSAFGPCDSSSSDDDDLDDLPSFPEAEDEDDSSSFPDASPDVSVKDDPTTDFRQAVVTDDSRGAHRRR